jgi:hypothetical protein
MITRRNILVGAAATVASKAAVPWASAPNIVPAANPMPIHGIKMPIERNYYGFVDRLQINHHYYSGNLRGEALLRLINEGVLGHIPPARLGDDIARWAQPNCL